MRFTGFLHPGTLRPAARGGSDRGHPHPVRVGLRPVFDAFAMASPSPARTRHSFPGASRRGAAVLFDPRDAAGIANAIETVWSDDDVRASLVAAGQRRIAAFSWELTAAKFRAFYRSVSGRPLSADDRALLSQHRQPL